MATTETKRILTLECKICEEGFRDEGAKVPRLLPCGHTLCHSCLRGLARRDSFIHCPFDRSKTRIGPEGIRGLKKNFALLEIVPTGDPELKEARIGVGKGKIPEIFNDFSTYVEFGGEDCVLEDARVNISDEERITIVVSVAAAPLDVAVGLVKHPPVDENQKGSGEEVKWQPLPRVHAYSVTQPKKDWQLRVLKKWPSYHIAHSFSIVPVSRRYEHFDWLRERLEAKYPFVSIPPLPDKPNPDHGEPESTETLRRRLESWLQRVGEHPVLARSLIWKHFITCNDERDWARGKRMAEWDRFIGAKFFLAIDAPETRLCLESVEHQIEGFQKSLHSLEVSLGNLQTMAIDRIEKIKCYYWLDHLRVANAIQHLRVALDADAASCLDDVKNALTFMGKSYCRLATLCENQPKTDWELMREKILEYLSMLSPFRHIFRLHKGAVAKRKEYERLRAEGKCEPENVDGVLRREEIVSYAVLAEMAHFRQLLHTDLYIFVKTLLSEQIAFYTQVAEKLEDSLRQYS